MKILLLNGINPDTQGAGVSSLKYWQHELKKKNIKLFTKNFVPLIKNNFLNNFYKFFFYLPGSLFRIFNLIYIFEYCVKINFFDYFFLKKNIKIYNQVILNHHSTFYLVFFFKDLSAIVHDLIYLKSKNRKKIKFFQKIIFNIELFILKRFKKIFIQSYYEYRLLKKFIPKSDIYLIKCRDINIKKDPKILNNQKKIKKIKNLNILADWRRKENYLALLKFFLNSKNLNQNFLIYGYTNFIVKYFILFLLKFKKNFFYHGEFINKNNLKGLFIIDISCYGSGIETKLIDFFDSKKIFLCSNKNLQGSHYKLRTFPYIKLANIYNFSIQEVISICNKYNHVKKLEEYIINYKKYYLDLSKCL